MPESPAMAGRAALALALMVGFYLLALGIARALLYLPFGMASMDVRLPAKLAILSVLGGGTIIWSVVPRPERFHDPGPRLLPERHPRLFETIREVASRTSQEMPSEVFLVPDVNAWVAQRGGIMAFGSRRVMGLGLPLLQTVTTTELKAILAHELGHYHRSSQDPSRGSSVRCVLAGGDARAASGRVQATSGARVRHVPVRAARLGRGRGERGGRARA